MFWTALSLPIFQFKSFGDLDFWLSWRISPTLETRSMGITENFQVSVFTIFTINISSLGIFPRLPMGWNLDFSNIQVLPSSWNILNRVKEYFPVENEVNGLRESINLELNDNRLCDKISLTVTFKKGPCSTDITQWPVQYSWRTPFCLFGMTRNVTCCTDRY